MRLIVALLFVFCLFLPQLAVAQDAAPLVTDRPDFTESPVTVPAQALQVEAGFTYAGQAADLATIGEVLTRYGLRDRLELRVGLPSFATRDDAANSRGLTDLSVGFKYQMGPLASGWDVAILGGLSLPTGDDAFTSDSADPSAILVAGRSLTDRMGIAGQVRGILEGPDNDAILESTVVMGVSLAQDLNGFLELAARFQDGVDTGLQLHTGVTSLIRPGFQLDLHTGIGLSGPTPDWFIGAGFAFRR